MYIGCGMFGFRLLSFPQNKSLSQFVCFLRAEPSIFTFKKESTYIVKVYKPRQTKLSKFVYFSHVLREQKETKTKYSAP